MQYLMSSLLPRYQLVKITLGKCNSIAAQSFAQLSPEPNDLEVVDLYPFSTIPLFTTPTPHFRIASPS